MIFGYDGPPDDYVTYINNAIDWTNFSMDAVVGDLQTCEIRSLADAIERREGYGIGTVGFIGWR